MKLAIIESPYAGNIDENVAYARECVLDALERNYSPIASHLLLTQVLNDDNPEHREFGISAGLSWAKVADVSLIYIDRGISAGMQRGIDHATSIGLSVERRSIKKSCGGPLDCPGDCLEIIYASRNTAFAKGWQLVNGAECVEWVCPSCAPSIVAELERLGNLDVPPPIIEIET